MLKSILKIGPGLALLLLLTAPVFATDCIEGDVEAPAQVALGEMATFSAELTNCSGEAKLVTVSATITYEGGPSPIPPPAPKSGWMAAGETIAKTIDFEIPMIVPLGFYEVCITAEAGEASATECVVIEVIESTRQPESTGTDCLELDIEAPSEIIIGEIATFSAELTNCGDEAALVIFTIEATHEDTSLALPPVNPVVFVPAGETYSKTIEVPIPYLLPLGTYEVCVTAEAGEASVTDCFTTEVTGVFHPGAGNGDCIELDIEGPAQVAAGDVATFSAELTNCSDEAARIELSIAITFADSVLPLLEVAVPVVLGAGETVTKTIEATVPHLVPPGVYEICITAESGEASATDCVTTEVTTSKGQRFEGDITLPIDYQLLEQNYPNPFNPSTEITFTLPKAGQVSLTISDVTGRMIKTLLGSQMNAGLHTVTWDGTNNRGEVVASGVYFYRLTAGEITETRKMVLMK